MSAIESNTTEDELLDKILEVQQVDDDLACLEQMLSDHSNASNEFLSASRWAGYSDSFVGYLRSVGLHDFRGRRQEKSSPGYVLARFGAVDINPSADRPGAAPEELYHAAKTCWRGASSKSVHVIQSSRVGNPGGFEIGGKFFTLSWLNSYCRYAYASTYIDFNDQVIVEVGSGSGKQAELLKRAHPNLTILIFDLPTQLYVANQYLSKVFEGTDQFVGYDVGRTVQSFSEIQKGKINVLPHWKFPIMRRQSFDLLWNTASFQEMGRDTALGYLKDSGGAKNLYMMYNIKFHGPLAELGNRGVISPEVITTHREIHRAEARLALRPAAWIYFDSWWKKVRYSRKIRQ